MFWHSFESDLIALNVTEHVRVRFETSQSAGQQRHHERSWVDTVDTVVQIGQNRCFPRNVGAECPGVLEVQQHHVFSVSTERAGHVATRRTDEYV